MHTQKDPSLFSQSCVLFANWLIFRNFPRFWPAYFPKGCAIQAAPSTCTRRLGTSFMWKEALTTRMTSLQWIPWNWTVLRSSLWVHQFKVLGSGSIISFTWSYQRIWRTLWAACSSSETKRSWSCSKSWSAWRLSCELFYFIDLFAKTVWICEKRKSLQNACRNAKMV